MLNFQIDGERHIPWSPISLDDDRITITFYQWRVVLQTDFGLYVSYDGVWVARVGVPRGLQTVGLCGNNNDNGEDDTTDAAELDKLQVNDPTDPK